MADEQPDDEPSEYDVDSLRVTREEARAALDHQIEALDDIDDKAAHTLRLNVLLLGVVLTMASVFASNNATPAIGRMANSPVVAGTLASGISMVTSIWVYSSTSYRTGTGPSDVRQFLSRNPPEEELLAALVYSYAAWMERNSQLNRRDGFTLFVSHLFLSLSTSYYAIGVLVGLAFPRSAWWVSLLAVAVVSTFVGVAVFALRYRLGLKLVGAVRRNINRP